MDPRRFFSSVLSLLFLLSLRNVVYYSPAVSYYVIALTSTVICSVDVCKISFISVRLVHLQFCLMQCEVDSKNVLESETTCVLSGKGFEFLPLDYLSRY